MNNKTMLKSVLLSSLLLGSVMGSALAYADDIAATDLPPTATENWLELQKSGIQASSNKQALSGPVLDRVNDRYLKSFTIPIPAKFERDSTTNNK